MAEIKKKTLRLTTLAVLGALAIVLSALENLIPPLPMMPPGAKLGLSNIVTLCAAGTFGVIPSLAVGILGAVAHNLAQLCVAVALTNSAVLSYLPFLLLYALVTGSVTGSALRILLPALKNVTRLGL